jgi:hypothetical protein
LFVQFSVTVGAADVPDSVALTLEGAVRLRVMLTAVEQTVGKRVLIAHTW